MANIVLKYPLVIAYGVQSDDQSLTFLTLAKEVTITEKISEVQSILKWCNGHRLLDEIHAKTNLDREDFENILEVLVEYGIVSDALSLGMRFHENSMYPLLVSNDLSPSQVGHLTRSVQSPKRKNGTKYKLPFPGSGGFTKLLGQRKSSRVFGEAVLGFQQLSTLLLSMYGKINHHSSVPSAGGLYQLRIFALVLKDIESLPRGCYEYLPSTHHLQSRHKDMSFELGSFLLDSKSMLKNASIVLCVAAEMNTAVTKYANRAYRLVLLEAGHVAQNAYLCCAEQKLSVVESGGFNDIELSRYLGLTFPNQPILTTLVVGSASENSEELIETYDRSEWGLRHELTREGGSVQTLAFSTYHYRHYVMPRYVAHAQYSSADPATPKNYEEFNVGTGTGLDLQEATVKALGEAFERRASGFVRTDMVCTRSAVPYPVYDLCDSAPLHPEYLRRDSLTESDQETVRAWVLGTRLRDNMVVAAPIDQVFYPVLEKDQGKGLTYHITSTGVATHPDKNKAIESGLLELIERDAIAVMWYGKVVPTKIPYHYLPTDTRIRVKNLSQAAKRTVVFCNLTLDSVPVVMCVIIGNSYPYLVTGSSAHWDVNRALNKSLDEAELMFHSMRKFPLSKRVIDPFKGVRNVMDHALFWAQSEMTRSFTWLLEGDETTPERKDLKLADLVERFDPAVIDLIPPFPVSLSTVRVVSSVLMPITFGQGAEHYRHPRVKMLGYEWQWQYPALPHCLA